MSERILLEKLLEEIITMRKLLEIVISDKLKTKLEEVATTSERKRIYALCDGLTSTDEIAQKVGVSQRAVQDVVKRFVERDLISVSRRGYPRRLFEWIPSEWKE
jgi:DNA-binding MarR family transcriptional regulator